MTIKFVWQGNPDTEATDGHASYNIYGISYDLHMPSFVKACELETVLTNVFAEGRRLGHTEMVYGITNAVNTITANTIRNMV